MGIITPFGHAISRRTFALALAAAGLRAAGPGELPAKETLSGSADGAVRFRLERKYRADAQVLLFGMPLLRREGVGGGSVAWSEFESAQGISRLLEFSGYSLPNRAAGLNRLGLIREMRLPAHGESEFRYFGLMTASPEESADQARQALHSAAKDQTYSVIDGRVSTGRARSVVAHFTAPAAESHPRLIDRAREALAGAEGGNTPVAVDRKGTFLQTLAEALHGGENADETSYVYSGRIYRMRLSRAADRKATEWFRQRGLIEGNQEVLRVTGRVRRESGGKESEFRLWIPTPSSHPVPLRIEYQPKSFLRLVFEIESSPS